MGLSGMLGSALSGLDVIGANLDLVGRNVANADTPGYTAKTRGQATLVANDRTSGVRLLDISREIDVLVQRQLRNERSGAGYANTVADFSQALDRLYGVPGQENAIDTLFNTFRQSFEALVATPDGLITQDQAINDAQVLTNTLNAMSNDIQSLRLSAENGIADGVERVNELLAELEDINEQISTTLQREEPPADMLDVRDLYITELSDLIDIRVIERPRGTVSIMTTNGTSLLDGKAARLTFDGRGAMTPQAQWSADDDLRGVGTIRLFSPNGLEIDLIADNAIRSGSIAGLIEMRDDRLVEAQAQLDAFAESLALSLTQQTVEGTAIAAPPPGQAGFEVDTTDIQQGDRINLTFTTPPGTTRNISIVRVDGTTTLSDPNLATTDPNDEVILVDFSGGLAAVEAAIEAALTPEVDVVVNGTGLQFLNDTAGTSTIDALSATVTEADLQGGGDEFPLFIDGGRSPELYSGRLEGVPQRVGFAQRITINDAVVDDPSLLVQSDPTTPIGDTSRPQFILDRITSGSWSYPDDTGIGGANSFSGPPSEFLQRIVADQGRKAENALRVQDAQSIAVTALEERFTATSKVDVDEEMARLIELQAAFQANARIISAYQELVDVLLAI
ncbi:MAG: flagellar hook-associated protein FlgK [Pseudomonadota bacterium]